MNVTAIDVDQKTAARHFAAYRSAVRERHTEEDEKIMRCYKALSKGQKLIDPSAAIIAAGANEVGLPKLAICRADERWCFWHVWEQVFSPRQHRGRFSRRRDFRLPDNTFRRTNATPHGDIRAAVPIVPPQLRPKHNLALYHILWEAEWQRIAPKDPLLLRHVSGPLFAVLVHWDLTEVERAVLQQRFSS